MKKIGLLSIIGCSVSGLAIAAGVDCSVIPTCAEMGFTKSVTDCDGKTLLRCPFDITNDNAVFCPDGVTIDESYNLDACPANAVCDEQGGKFKFQGCETGYTQTEENTCCSDEYYNLDTEPANATFEQCGNKYHLTSCNDGYEEENGTCKLPTGIGCTSIGNILYNDLNCYSTAPSGKTAIGVVFDTTNKLAIGLTEASNMMLWSNTSEDVSGLNNYTSNNKALADTNGGKANTAAIIAGSSTTNVSSTYAPGYCYNLTTGGLPIGSWFLPSLKELDTIFTNKSTIDSAITSAGGNTITEFHHWSSNEYSADRAWMHSMFIGSHVYDYSKTTFEDGYYVRCAINYANKDNEESVTPTCSTDYNLDTCPTNGYCTECGGKQKLESCANGYTVSGNTCVAATCAGQTSTTGCKTYTTCLSGTTNYYTCTACNSGYTLSGTKCVANTCAGSTSTTGCKTYTTCKSGTTTYYVCSACNSGYTLSASKCPKTSCSGQTSTTGCKTYSGTCLSGTTTYYLCTECYTGYKLSSNKCTKTCTYTNPTVLTDEYCLSLKNGYDSADSCVRGSASGEKTYYQCICAGVLCYAEW